MVSDHKCDAIPVLFVLLQGASRANGGVESASLVMANLVGHRPIILTNRANERVDEWRQLGWEVHLVNAEFLGRSFRKSPFRYLSTLWAFHRAIRHIRVATNVTVLHANDPMAMMLAITHVLSGKIRTVFCLRGSPGVLTLSSRLRLKFLLSICDTPLFLSEDMRSRWSRATGLALTHAKITRSIVKASLFEKPRVLEQKQPFIMICGRISKIKGQAEFLRQIGHILAARGLRIFLVGDFHPDEPGYEIECRNAAAPLGEFVEFHGYQSDVSIFYSRAVAAVIPSETEGLSRVMIEAMSCGCPVISFAVCSAREILIPGAGVVVELGDWRELAKAILHLAESPPLGRQIGSAGKKKALALFGIDRVVSSYEMAYSGSRFN